MFGVRQSGYYQKLVLDVCVPCWDNQGVKNRNEIRLQTLRPRIRKIVVIVMGVALIVLAGLYMSQYF